MLRAQKSEECITTLSVFHEADAAGGEKKTVWLLIWTFGGVGEECSPQQLFNAPFEFKNLKYELSYFFIRIIDWMFHSGLIADHLRESLRKYEDILMWNFKIKAFKMSNISSFSSFSFCFSIEQIIFPHFIPTQEYLY